MFGERNRVIQEASQYVMAQIDRAIEMVTQQVAISRGINLVLNRAQILGTTPDFDMTPEVVDDLNKVLPNVVIPPDGVSPMSDEAAAGATRRARGQPPRPPLRAPGQGAAREAAAHAGRTEAVSRRSVRAHGLAADRRRPAVLPPDRPA